MAKAKPKKAPKPKPKPKAKPKAKPKPKPKAMDTRAKLAAPAPAKAVSKPLIVRGVDPGSGAGIESGFAIESAVGFPVDCKVSATINDMVVTGATWSLVSFSFAGANNTILRIGIASTISSSAVGDSGTLVVGLTNPPIDLVSPVLVPVDYIDDLP